MPGTRKGEVDLLKVEEYIKKYLPFKKLLIRIRVVSISGQTLGEAQCP